MVIDLWKEENTPFILYLSLPVSECIDFIAKYDEIALFIGFTFSTLRSGIEWNLLQEFRLSFLHCGRSINTYIGWNTTWVYTS